MGEEGLQLTADVARVRFKVCSSTRAACRKELKRSPSTGRFHRAASEFAAAVSGENPRTPFSTARIGLIRKSSGGNRSRERYDSRIVGGRAPSFSIQAPRFRQPTDGASSATLSNGRERERKYGRPLS